MSLIKLAKAKWREIVKQLRKAPLNEPLSATDDISQKLLKQYNFRKQPKIKRKLRYTIGDL